MTATRSIIAAAAILGCAATTALGNATCIDPEGTIELSGFVAGRQVGVEVTNRSGVVTRAVITGPSARLVVPDPVSVSWWTDRRVTVPVSCPPPPPTIPPSPTIPAPPVAPPGPPAPAAVPATPEATTTIVAPASPPVVDTPPPTPVTPTRPPRKPTVKRPRVKPIPCRGGRKLGRTRSGVVYVCHPTRRTPAVTG